MLTVPTKSIQKVGVKPKGLGGPGGPCGSGGSKGPVGSEGSLGGSAVGSTAKVDSTSPPAPNALVHMVLGKESLLVWGAHNRFASGTMAY